MLTHQDACTGGNLLPVTVNHVYNTNDKDVDIGYGKGYRLNLSQIINLVTINNVEYAKYIDEDGTQHYFKREGTSNIYKDEDGLNLTLTLENDNFIMKDKNNSTLIFQKRTNSTGIKWHLKELKDKDTTEEIFSCPMCENHIRVLYCAGVSKVFCAYCGVDI